MDFVRQNIDQMPVQSDINLQMLIATPDDTIRRIDLQLFIIAAIVPSTQGQGNPYMSKFGEVLQLYYA